MRGYKHLAVAAAIMLCLLSCGCAENGEPPVSIISYDDFFVQITDLHISTAGTRERLDYVVAYINALDPAPACVVVTGDILDFGASVTAANLYGSVRTSLSNLTAPWYIIPGNHDYKRGIADTTPSSRHYFDIEFPEFAVYPYTATVALRGGRTAKMIFTDTGGDAGTQASIAEPVGEGLDAFQLDGISYSLSATAANYTYIMTHHPAVGPGNDTSQVFLENRYEFIALCQQYGVDGVVSGHTHQYAITGPTGGTWGGTGAFFLTTPDLAGDFPVALIPFGGTPEQTGVS